MEPSAVYRRHEYSPSLSPSDSGESLPSDPTGQIELNILDSHGHAYTLLPDRSGNRSGPDFRAPPNPRRTWAEWLGECNSDSVPCGYLVFILILMVWAVGTVIVVGVN
ncbi:hypothetical protein BDV06DRAFT_224843 [Aspergillus oleicola]